MGTLSFILGRRIPIVVICPLTRAAASSPTTTILASNDRAASGRQPTHSGLNYGSSLLAPWQPSSHFCELPMMGFLSNLPCIGRMDWSHSRLFGWVFFYFSTRVVQESAFIKSATEEAKGLYRAKRSRTAISHPFLATVVDHCSRCGI